MSPCAAVNCANRDNRANREKGITFHRFPCDDPKRLRKWLISVKWENWKPTKNSKICSEHFTEDCFDRTGQTVRLKLHAVPTIFNFPKHLQKTTTSRKTRVAQAAEDAAQKASTQLPAGPPSSVMKKSILLKVVEVSQDPCDHNYATMDSRPALKRKLDDITERLQLCKKKLKLEQQNSRRLLCRVTNLSSLIVFLQDKRLISSNCADLLEATLSGVPKEIRERVLNRSTQRISGLCPQELRSFAMTLHFFSEKAYIYVRQAFDIALPHPRQIRSWYSGSHGNPGFTKSAFYALRIHAKEDKKVGKETLCGVLIDEMSICRRVEYTNGCHYGYVDIGQGYFDDTAPVAKDVFVLMAVSLNATWKTPLGYFLLDKLNGEEQANLILQCLCRLHNVGVQVVALTCGGPSCHFTMMHHLGVNMNVTDTDHSFIHPADSSQKVYIIFDLCYMLKLLRNSFTERGLLWTRDGSPVKWQYLEELDLLQKARQNLGDMLYCVNIQWRKQKMKVNLAEQVFSASVADSLQYCNEELKLPQFEGCEATVEFIRHIDSAFDILNSCNPLGKGLKAPMNRENFDRMEEILGNAKQFLLNLKDDAGDPVYVGARRTGFVGFVVSIDSVIKLFTELVGACNAPLSYLVTYKFSQDHLALFFASVRSQGGLSNPPTAQQFQEAYKFLLRRPHKNCTLIGITEIPYAKDITQSTISIGRKYDLPTRQLTENEQDYADLPDFEYSSLFKDAAISLVAGRVVEMMTERLHCMQCIYSLRASDSKNPDCARVKDDRGQIKASTSIVSLCQETERCFQWILKTLNGKPLQKLKIPYEISLDVLHKSADMNLFSDLRTHQFETAVEDNHIHKLIRMASYCYSKIRLFHMRNRNME